MKSINGFYFNTNLTLSAEFFLYVEAGTGFGGELVVTVDGGERELFLQLFYECTERGFLCCRPSVLGLAVGRQTADIADADTDRIVTFAVCANLACRPTCLYAAVTIYHEVITYAAEASLAMPTVDVLDGEVLALCGGTAMNDDFCYFSHDFSLFDGIFLTEVSQVLPHTPCFTLIEQALSAFFNVNYV